MAGEPVIALNDLVKQLQSSVGTEKANEILASLAASQEPQVGPGSLIQSDWAIRVSDRLAQLEGPSSQPAINAKAITTLSATWSAFAALAKKGSFLPEGNSADAIRSSTTITAFLQDVAQAAISAGPSAYLPQAGALLGALKQLYLRQHDLAVLFAAPIPGITDAAVHKRFSSNLKELLDVNDTLSGLSLNNAIEAANLDAALLAQDRINGMVMAQGGDVTTGNLEVRFAPSSNSETLVINGAKATLVLFDVRNRTNRKLPSIQLASELVWKGQAQAQYTSAVDATTGNALRSVPLDPYDANKPNDPAGVRRVGVAVMTPGDAVVGDKGTVRLIASVPQPVNVLDSDARSLTVAAAEQAPPPATVTFNQDAPVVQGDLANASEGGALILDFGFRFAVLQGPTEREFRCRSEVTSSAAEAPLFTINFGPAALAIETNTVVTKTSKAITMKHNDERTWRVVVKPLAGAKTKVLTFKAIVESSADGIRDEQLITITVK